MPIDLRETPKNKNSVVERELEVLKRQRFHRPCRTVKLKHADFRSLIATFDSTDRPSIFWLDYTDLKYPHYEDFSALVTKLAPDSLVKITLRAEWKDFAEDKKPEEFQRMFGALLPNPDVNPPIKCEAFVQLVQDMLRVAGEKALPASSERIFQPICTFYYSDGTSMFTATGIVCTRSEQSKLCDKFKRWKFAALDWSAPKRIDVPTLTTKERLHLQSLLPTPSGTGQRLRRRLGYLIDNGKAKTESQLVQYEIFHRYYPYVMRAVP
ncbi:MAG: O-methyltransferase [Candidatus Binataceae bacterium]